MSRPVAYYNEIDPYAADWLRNLIAAGLITAGEVDTRSIVDVRPDDVRGFARCHFFAGIGVWDYALGLAGWPIERPVWTGSCPCQPFSAAGGRGGFSDERHVWPSWHHLIRECRPPELVGEQVASKDGLGWLDLVQADLEGSGYAGGAIDLCAAGVGAPHIRQRQWLWFVADTGGERCDGQPAQLRQSGSPGWVALDRSEAAWSSPVGALANTSGERRHGGELPGEARAAPADGRAEDGRGSAGVREPAGRGPAIVLGDANSQHDEHLSGGVLTAQKSRPGRGDYGSSSASTACELADAHGGDTGAERQQRGGEHRLLTSDGLPVSHR